MTTEELSNYIFCLCYFHFQFPRGDEQDEILIKKISQLIDKAGK